MNVQYVVTWAVIKDMNDFNAFTTLSLQARAACSAFVFGFVTFMSIGGFPSFVEEMKVKFRRYYFICKLENAVWIVVTFPCFIYIGFPAGTAEWALWCCGICHQQHHLSNTVPDPDMLLVGNHMLLYGAPPSWFRTLYLLRLEPIRQCHRGRELNDGHCQCNSQFSHGYHHRSWNSGMAFSPVSHVIFCALITYFCLGYVLGYVVMDGIKEKKLASATNFIRISLEWTEKLIACSVQLLGLHFNYGISWHIQPCDI